MWTIRNKSYYYTLGPDSKVFNIYSKCVSCMKQWEMKMSTRRTSYGSSGLIGNGADWIIGSCLLYGQWRWRWITRLPYSESVVKQWPDTFVCVTNYYIKLYYQKTMVKKPATVSKKASEHAALCSSLCLWVAYLSTWNAKKRCSVPWAPFRCIHYEHLPHKSHLVVHV